MKNNVYLKQLFEEGLGTTFYQKPKRIINNNLENPFIKKLLLSILQIIYILFLIICIIIIFKFNFPL